MPFVLRGLEVTRDVLVSWGRMDLRAQDAFSTTWGREVIWRTFEVDGDFR